MWRTWKLLRSAGVEKPLTRTIGMLLRGSIDDELLTAVGQARKAGLPITPFQLEAHYLAGGRPGDLVAETVRLEEYGKRVDHQVLATIDLLQGNLKGTVQDCLRSDRDTVESSLKTLADRLKSEREHIRGQRVAQPLSDHSAEESKWLQGWRLSLLFGLLLLIGYVTSEAVIEDPSPWIEVVSILAFVTFMVVGEGWAAGIRKIVDRNRWKQVLILTLVLAGVSVWLWISLMARNAR